MKISKWSYFALLGAWILSVVNYYRLRKELKEQEKVLDFYRKVVNAYYYRYGRYKGIPKVRVEDNETD